jgi:MscS family membrane protein
VLMRVAANTPSIVRDPEPRVRMRGFGASSLDFELLLWVEDPREKGLQTHHLLKSIYKAFNEEGVIIAFPQLDVHFDKEPVPFRETGNETLFANKF